MTTINLNRGSNGAGSSEDRPILPTDIYRMKIVDANVEDDTLSKPNRDGTYQQKIVLTLEVTALTDEQQEAADEAGQTWTGVRIWHRFNPYYGDVRDGGPSKFKDFIDRLRAQGHLPNFDVEAFDVGDLIDIEQKVTVQEYIKTMGPNAGKPGNKVIAFAALRAPKSGATKAARNVPQPVAATEGDDDLDGIF